MPGERWEDGKRYETEKGGVVGPLQDGYGGCLTFHVDGVEAIWFNDGTPKFQIGMTMEIYGPLGAEHKGER